MKMDFSYRSRRIIVFLRLFIFVLLPAAAYGQNIYVIGSINEAQTKLLSFSLSGNLLTKNMEMQVGVAAGFHAAMDSRTNVIFMTTEGGNKIRYYSALTGNFINESQSYASGNFAGIAFDNSRSKLYAITKYTNRLYCFTWNSVDKTLNLDGGTYFTLQNAHQGLGLAVDEVNGHLYVADRTEYVKRYRTSDFAYSAQYQVGLFATNVAFDSRNNYLYSGAGAPAGSNFLSRLNVATNIEKRVDIGSSVLAISTDDITDNVFVTTYNYGTLASSLVAFTEELTYIHHYNNINPYGLVVSKSISSPNPLGLSLTHQTAPDGFFEPGEAIYYRICYNNVNNPGIHATGVTVTCEMPAQLEFDSATAGYNYVLETNTISWNLGTVFGGAQEACITLKAKVKATTDTGTSIVNTVRISCNEIPQSFATKTSLVNAQYVKLLSPNGGQKYVPGSKVPISWESKNINSLKIEYTVNGTVFNTITGGGSVAAVPATTTWTATNEVSDNCKIRISSLSRPNHFDESDAVFSILDPNKYTIKIHSPNGGERWLSGESKSISYSANAATLQNLKVEYSTDAGATWLTIAGNHLNGSQLGWDVGRTPSSHCLVRISSLDLPEVYDVSDAVFSIVGVDLTSPDGGERYLFNSTHNITWNSNEVSSIKIEYTTNSGSSWNTIEESYPASAKYYTWTLPNTPSETAKVRIRDTQRSSIWDESSVPFTINSLLLKSPVGGEVWMAGTTHEISWEFGEVNFVKLEYTTDNGVRWITIESHFPASTKKYDWQLPKVDSKQCYVKITSLENPAVYDTSPAAFEISGSGITLTAPVGGESWASGIKKNITWSSVNVNFIKIEFTSDGGLTWETITDNLAASFGKYDWLVPNSPSVECRIKITDIENPALVDSSSSYFKVGGFPYAPPGSWRFKTHTGGNAVIVLPRVINPQIGDRSFQAGDAVGVFFLRDGAQICGGYAKWEDGQNLAITVWGDNPRTLDKDGFATNEKYIFKIWDAFAGEEILAEATFESLYSSDPDKYSLDKISIIKTFKSHSELQINLRGNLWSLISSNIVPYPSDIVTVMSDVKSALDYMKNDLGEIYHPAENVNSILNWKIKDGYQINMKQDATLTIRGTRAELSSNQMTFAAQKWYIIAYLPQTSMDISTALGSISTALLMVKNSAGQIYFPQYNINHIINMNPGEGYKLSVSQTATLTYPQPNASIFIETPPFGKQPDIPLSGKYEPHYTETGNSAVIIIESDEIPEGSEFGVFTADGASIGNAVMTKKSAVITVWGDNPATSGIIEGATGGEVLVLRYVSSADGKEYIPDIKKVANMLTGKSDSPNFKYKQDAVWLAQSGKGSPAATVGNVTQDCKIIVSPNPAGNHATFAFELSDAAAASLSLYDMLGREVARIAEGMYHTGINKIEFDASKIAPGVYFYLFTSSEKVEKGNFVIIR